MRHTEPPEAYGFDPQRQHAARRELRLTTALRTGDLVLSVTLPLLLAIGALPLYASISRLIRTSWLSALTFTWIVLAIIELPRPWILLLAHHRVLKEGSLRSSSWRLSLRSFATVPFLALAGTAIFSVPYWAADVPWQEASWGAAATLWYLYAMVRQWGWWWFPYGARHVRADVTVQERVKPLAKRAKVKPPRVVELDSDGQPIAMAAYVIWMGFDRILISKPLRELLTPEELDAILAHEVAHKCEALFMSLPLLIWIVTAAPALGFGLPRLAAVFGTAAQAIPALTLFIFLCEGIRLALLPITNAVSRWVERRADRRALRITANPEAFRTAMIKVYNFNRLDAAPSGWWQFLFGTHPTGIERVRSTVRSAKGEGR